MEPATTFATIVGLIANFKSSRDSQDASEHQDFVTWLITKGHNRLAEDINANHLLISNIRHLLQDQHKELSAQLAAISNALGAFASQIPEFKAVADAISPTLTLSNQAISILTQIELAGGSRFMELKTFGGTDFQIWDGKGGMISITDERFIEDDLDRLCTAGLLKPDRNSQGYRLWHITREASFLVKRTRLGEDDE